MYSIFLLLECIRSYLNYYIMIESYHNAFYLK